MTDLPLILALSIRARLEASARPEVAVGVRNFFREPVDPIGVRSRVLQKVVAEVYRAVKKWPVAARNRLCTLLWEGGKMEEGVLVCHLYRRFAKQCAGPEFRMFERWIDGYVHNWAHCDGVSSWLLAACVANEPALMDKLPRWTRSKNRWKRRAAAVSLLQEAKKGRSTETIFAIAGMLRNDADDMVQKGVGWLLKETYPSRPRQVVSLLTGWSGAPRLMLRYACEKMTPGDRARVLGQL
ncbi:MAG: DNA alkylation repair protein [Bryobacteraceae bacterium]|jgi:3-methyladenine DNA glycosylase AlkD